MPTSKHDLPADRCWIRAELRPPERVADNGEWLAHVIDLKRTTTGRRDAKQRQQSRRDIGRAHPFGCTEPRERHVCRVVPFDRRPRSSTLAPALERLIPYRAGRCTAVVGQDLAEGDEGLRIGERRRRQQYGVDDGEDRGAGAERQRQRQDRSYCASRGVANVSQQMTKVDEHWQVLTCGQSAVSRSSLV